MNFERVVVIGCGGTGSWLIPALARLTESRPILLVDGDRVSESNVARQNFIPGEVGRSKAECLVGSCAQGRPSDAPVPEVAEGFYGTANAGLVQEGDLVMVCPDNHACRKAVIDRLDQLANGAAVICGNEEHDGSVTVYIRSGGRKMTPHPYERHPEFCFTSDGDRSGMSCADLAALPGGGQTLSANFMCSAIALSVASSLLSGKKWRAYDVYFDTLLGAVRPVTEA